jgi:hypothetical protein
MTRNGGRSHGGRSVQPAVVIAIVDCILDATAGGKPRGSIAEFSHEECRSALELRTTGPVKKVVKALEKMGWIDREYLTKWDEPQPDKKRPNGGRTAAKKAGKTSPVKIKPNVRRHA